MSDATVFRAVQTESHQIGRNQVLVVSPDHNAAIQLDNETLQSLRRCSGARTVGQHGAAVVGADLERLAGLGLLVPLNEQVVRGAVNEVPITTVAVLTADRPATLKRCLEAIGKQCADYAHTTRVLVVDNSSDAAQAGTNASYASTVRRASLPNLVYHGPAEREAWKQRLVRAGVPEEILRFALSPRPGSPGPGRNASLLLTAGEHIVLADDDTVWEPWALPFDINCVACAGHTDLREMEFFETREEALNSVLSVQSDLLAAHAAVLGRDTWSLLWSADVVPDLSHACAHILASLAGRRGMSKIRATFAGLSGDAGSDCPYELLFANTPALSRLALNSEECELAFSSRNVTRIATQPTITHNSACMAYCMGLDNTSAIPPFLPVGTNEDGVFGRMLMTLDLDAMFAHIPLGVVHDPQRRSLYDHKRVLSASRVRLAEVMLLMTRVAEGAMVSSVPSVRLACLARVMADVGGLPLTDFQDFIRRLLVAERSRELVYLEGVAGQAAACPEHIRRRSEAFRSESLAAMAVPGFFVPVEFKSDESLDASWIALRRFIGEFAELLSVWDMLRRECVTAYT